MPIAKEARKVARYNHLQTEAILFIIIHTHTHTHTRAMQAGQKCFLAIPLGSKFIRDGYQRTQPLISFLHLLPSLLKEALQHTFFLLKSFFFPSLLEKWDYGVRGES